MRIIQGEKRIEELSVWRDGVLPFVLQEDPQRFLARNSPSPDQIDSLLTELRRYLGIDGCIWLCACAIYPELHWQITISLGELLKDGHNNSLLRPQRLVDLARLPWFRHGTMPDWLRMRLILDLPPGQAAEVRAALEALLVTAVQGHGEALDLEIAHERREWTSRLARSLLGVLRRKVPHDSPIQDRVFLDFMLRRWNLAVRVPQALRRQLFARHDNQSGWKSLLRKRIVNIPVQTTGPTSFYKLWMTVLTRPSVQTFAVIAASPNAKVTTAFLWVFFSSLVWGIGFVLAIFIIAPELNDDILIAWLISGFMGFIGVTIFAVGSAIVHWLAKLFGGRGTYQQLSYTSAAIIAPTVLIGLVYLFLSLFSNESQIMVIRVAGLLAGLYAIVLHVMAIKAIYKFG
jgi:hypothetical protein